MNDFNKKAEVIGGGKVILGILLSLAILVIAQVLSMGLAILYPAITLFLVYLLCSKVLKVSLKECKITKLVLKPIWCAAAFIMPVMVCAMLFLFSGDWKNTSMNTGEIWSVATQGILYFGLAVGIVEEVIFRGVILSVLELRYQKWVAVLAPSMIFGLLHIFGNNLGFIDSIQVFVAGSLVGILFSLVTYESGSIWCAALMHGVWNMIMIGGIVHIGTSAEEASVFNYVLDTKSFLITGGAFGVESSVISVAAYLIFTLLAVVLIRKKRAVE